MKEQISTGNEKGVSGCSERFERALTGSGSDFVDADEAMSLAEYALSQGFGVLKMEAYGTGDSRGKHRLWHQVLGIDEFGENWVDHRSPARALEIVRQKIALAQKDDLTLMYKFWFDYR